MLWDSSHKLVKMETPKSRKTKFQCPFERASPRMEDVALQQIKAKQCVVWLKDKLTTEGVKHSTRPKAYRVDSSRGQRSNLTGDSCGSNFKTKRDNIDCGHHENDKTIGTKLMESLIVDGCGVKFYNKKSSPISYKRIWTTPVNRKGNIGGGHQGPPISSSLFAVTCFLKLRQTTAAQKANERILRNDALDPNPNRRMTNIKPLNNNKASTETKCQKKSEKTETDLGVGIKQSLQTPEMKKRQRVSKKSISYLKILSFSKESKYPYILVYPSSNANMKINSFCAT